MRIRINIYAHSNSFLFYNSRALHQAEISSGNKNVAIWQIKIFAIETQRLYTILPIMSREADEDTTVGGIPIKRGTMVLWNTEIIHHNPGCWI